jgi:3-oxoacyl-[acyl-carrier protein] reductase
MQYHFITGAASGIGFELARILLQRGDSVLACDVRTEPLEGLRLHAVSPQALITQALDVRLPEEWERVVNSARSQWPRIDSVMNVAGVMHPGFIDEIRTADIDLHLDVNVKGTIYGTQAAFRAMREQTPANGRGRGHIINLCSLAGLTPVPGIALYSASKFAVRAYSLSLLHELRAHAIALTVVYPDGTATPMLMPYAHVRETALIFTGFRLLKAEDVARAIVDRALVKRPMELAVPRHRALLTKVAGSVPALATPLLGAMTRLGLRRQKRL